MDYSKMTGDGRKQREKDRVQSMVANPNATAGASGLSSAHKLKGPLNVEENNLASGGRARSRADRYARSGAVKADKPLPRSAQDNDVYRSLHSAVGTAVASGRKYQKTQMGDPEKAKYARGGSVKKPTTSININLTMGAKKDEEEKPDPAAALQAALAAAPPPPPPGPPSGMDPSAGPPGMGPGALPGMGMPGMKRGGSVKSPKMSAGAGSGEGRLEKTDDQRRLRKVLGN